MKYTDRFDAGRALVPSVEHLRAENPLVLALPRGGVPVAFSIAAALGADLDVLLVRKLGVPAQPELAMGAIGEGGFRVVNDRVVAGAGVSADDFADVEKFERIELDRRADLWQRTREIPRSGRRALIVDDGMATGATAMVACLVAQHAGITRIVVAVPIASPDAVARIKASGTDVVCPLVTSSFDGVGAAYDDFHQLTDEEVAACLK